MMELPETMGDVERLMYALVEKQAEVTALRKALEEIESLPGSKLEYAFVIARRALEDKQ